MPKSKKTDKLTDLILEGGELLRSGDAGKSRTKFREALGLAEQMNVSAIFHHIYLNLHHTYMLEGNAESAEKALDEARRAVAKVTDNKEKAFVAYYRFRFFYGGGRMVIAGREITKAIEFVEKSAEAPLNLKSDIHRSAGMYHIAVEEYEKAIEVLGRAGEEAKLAEYSFGEGAALAETGLAYQNMDNFDDAEAAYNKALAVFERSGEVEHIGGALHDLGNLEVERERYAEALGFYRRALEKKREAGAETPSIEATLRMLAISSAEAGDYEAAIKASVEAADCVIETGPRNAYYLASMVQHEILTKMRAKNLSLEPLAELGGAFEKVVEAVKVKIGAEGLDLEQKLGEETEYPDRFLVLFVLWRYARVIAALAAPPADTAELDRLAVWIKELTDGDIDVTGIFETAGAEEGRKE